MDKDSSLHCWLGAVGVGLRALPREVLLLGRLPLMMEAPRRKGQLCFSCHGLRRPPRQRPASSPVSDACKWVSASEWAWGVAWERSKEGHLEASPRVDRWLWRLMMMMR